MPWKPGLNNITKRLDCWSVNQVYNARIVLVKSSLFLINKPSDTGESSSLYKSIVSHGDVREAALILSFDG